MLSQAFPLPSLSRKQRTVLVVCGPEQNGAVGLACARHLRVFVSSRVLWRGGGQSWGWGSAGDRSWGPAAAITGPGFPQEYQPSIFCPVRSANALHRDLTTQCEKMDIPFLSFLPAEVSCTHSDPATARLPSRPLTPPHSPQVRLIDDAYGLVVDAVLGPGVRPAEAGGPCARALATLKRLSIPLVSLDVPSGMPPRGSLVTLACFPYPPLPASVSPVCARTRAHTRP